MRDHEGGGQNVGVDKRSVDLIRRLRLNSVRHMAGSRGLQKGQHLRRAECCVRLTGEKVTCMHGKI